MSRIKIKNFGPIKEGLLENDGWIDIKKVTMFIGNQGSGKSTVAKLISTFMWMEKALYRGDMEIEKFNTPEKSFSELSERFEYFKIDHYFSINTHIEYIGDAFAFTCKGTKEPIYTQTLRSGKLRKSVDNFDHLAPTGIVFSVNKIEETTVFYNTPQIIYVPSERNVLSLSNQAFELADLPGAMDTFALEYLKSRNESNGAIKLPIGNYEIEYDSGIDKVLLHNNKDADYNYFTFLEESSSGFQSLVPLFLTSRRLALSVVARSKDSMSPLQKLRLEKEVNALYEKSNLSNDQKELARQKIESKYKISCFVNIVEELEQNLFPTSQKDMLYSLLGFNNMLPENTLILTTHSPYLINYLTVSIGAFNLIEKIKTFGKSDTLIDEVYKVITKENIVNPEDLVIYEMDETSGKITLLGNYRGLPSDENKLNVELGSTNDEYSKLLEIEKLCR